MNKIILSLIVFVSLLSGCKKEDVSNNDITNGLILHIPFTGNLLDVSSNKNNATFTAGSAAFVVNRYFDESKALNITRGQYVEVADKGISGLGQFTFYLEFYPRSSGFQVLVGKRTYEVATGKPYNQSFNIAINDLMQVRAQLRKAGQCQSQELSAYHPELNSGNNQVLMDCWNYVACTFDGSMQRLYLNGKLVAQQTLSGVVICDTDPVRLGAWWKGDPFFFDGLLDEFRIYNRALSETEIRQLYKLTK